LKFWVEFLTVLWFRRKIYHFVWERSKDLLAHISEGSNRCECLALLTEVPDHSRTYAAAYLERELSLCSVKTPEA
jgi:hypothetical protein